MFRIDATSNLPLEFEWYHNEQKLIGQNEASLVLNHLTLDMDGSYSCKVYNEIKEAMSEVEKRKNKWVLIEFNL